MWRSCVLVFLVPLAALGCDDDSTEGDVFDRTLLHRVEIAVDAQYLGQLETDLENRVPCTITYDGEEVKGAGIRQKGNLGSVQDLSSKPSFSVKLDEFDDKGELWGVHKLLLNNTDQDSTFLHELVGSEMYARAGLPAARIAHGVVSLNGLEYGLYVVAEAVDKDLLQLHFGKENDEGNLYEGPCCGDFVTDVDHMELKDEAKDHRSRDDIRALADIVLTAPDGEFEASVSERLDLDRFITGYAIDAILDHWDGYSYERMNNYYMYDNPADSRFVFIPHGMDRILRDVSFDPETLPSALVSLRVRQIPSLDARFHGEVARVVEAVWDEAAILAAIDQAAAVVHSADGSSDRTQNDVAVFDANLAGFRDALAQRRQLLNP